MIDADKIVEARFPFVRLYRREDRGGVVATVMAGYTELNYTMDFEAFDRDLEDIERSYRDLGGEFWVLDDHGEIVGCVGITPAEIETCEVHRLYLRGPLRGHGWGHRLLETALAWARSAGFRRAILWSDVLFERARDLYEKSGFTPTEKTRAVDPVNPTSVERLFWRDL